MITFKPMFGEKKPNLLILDEIDYNDLGKYIIKILLNLFDTKNKYKYSFLGPIICICNDFWSKPLIPIKSYCLILQLPIPSFQKLLDRLEFICKKEKIHINHFTLKHLITLTNHDIRS